jgi:predicted nucleic acid-binding protein
MVLADTSIWVDFFRAGTQKARMEQLIRQNQLLTHPYLVAELALGNLRHRQQTLRNLEQLPQASVVTLFEVRAMIEARHLYGTGIGLIDAHLVASCLAAPGTTLWTRDNRLAGVATSLEILQT